MRTNPDVSHLLCGDSDSPLSIAPTPDAVRRIAGALLGDPRDGFERWLDDLMAGPLSSGTPKNTAQEPIAT